MMPPINVKMVDADRLGDYEIWLFAASICVSTAVGFLVAYLQGSSAPSGGTEHQIGLCMGAGVAFVLFLAFFGRALWIRRELSREANTYAMRAEQIPQQQDTS
jgi:hypothetical protein